MSLSSMIAEDFKTGVSIIDRTSRQKISKDIEDLNTVNQLDLIDVYEILQQWSTH